MVCLGIEFKLTTYFSKLPLTATRTLNEHLNVTGKVSQSTPARAFGAFNNFVSAHDNCCRQAIALRTQH
jgi:hypothetical protein